MTDGVKEQIYEFVVRLVSDNPIPRYTVMKVLSDVGVPPDLADEVIWQLVLDQRLSLEDGIVTLSDPLAISA